MKRAVGIDLGTTYSVASWIDGTGRSAIITNSEGDLLTPTVVAFDDDQVIVGKEAIKLGVLKPDRLAECVKRDMGNPFYSRAISGEYLPPEVIQAFVLKKLGLDIRTRIGPDFAVVITVPAFFDDPRRRATAIAGEIAGLHVLDIVNEPVAAALAFGEHLSSLRPEEVESGPIHVLVYDLGGGTFDASLLRISSLGFRTLATDGDVHLGGRDWDMRLVDLCCEAFIKRFREDPRDNPVSLQRLMVEVERAKHTLSARQQAIVRLDHTGNHLDVEVTRDEFEERTADLLERTAHTTQELIRTAGLECKDISRILLSGGSTRMPMVRKMLQERCEIAPGSMVSPDEAAARGAALYARYLLDSASDSPPEFKITNVSSHSLGIQGVELDTGQKVNAVLIPRNTPLPAKATRTFVTRRKNQRQIAILVLEGESSLPSECTVIGRSVVQDLPANLPAGYPVEVTFEYSTNGRLHVHARLPDVDRSVDIVIERGARLADERVAEWRKLVGAQPNLRSIKDLLQRDRDRQPRAWRQLHEGHGEAPRNKSGAEGDEIRVEYHEIVLPSELTRKSALERLEQDTRTFHLDLTEETVRRGEKQIEPGKEQYGSLESVYGPSVSREWQRKRKREIKVPWLQIVLGGVAGLIIAQLIIWWLMELDPFGTGPLMPPWVNWLVPQQFR